MRCIISSLKACYYINLKKKKKNLYPEKLSFVKCTQSLFCWVISVEQFIECDSFSPDETAPD